MRVRWANLNIWIFVCALIVISCSKGKSTIDKSRENYNYIAETAKNYLNIPSRYTFSENIEFFVATQNGTPLPAIGSEFKAFDITALYEGGSEIKPEKIPVMLKTFQDNWNTNFFNLKASGEISTVVTCEYATSREGCVGDLTGSSSKTDRDGRAFTGYKTPDGPGSVVAVVLKVPEGSSASNLMQYATVQIQAWSNWGKNGESPLEATLLLVPQLEDDNGNPVVKAGVGFSVNLIVPGLPTTPKGSGFAFDIETTGVPGVDNDRVVVPSGKNVNCNFRGGLCSIPGGPFKVLSPTTMTISVKPSDPSFPVKPATLTIPVISGRARTIMLSTTYPAIKVTNICLSDTDFSRPCIDISADIDELQVYPFLADEGGNFVGFVPTQWSATGPLATRLLTDKVDSFQKILPITTGSGIISVTTEKGISAQFTYMIRSGAPSKVQFKTEHSIGSNSTERVGVPFKVISSLYDKKDNLCVDYNTTFGVKLKLNNVYPATPPPGIVATANLVDQIDQTVDKILVTRGIGTTTGSFTVVKVPDLGSGQLYPTISILDSTLLVSIINGTPITILPGNVTQSQLRNLAGGLGTSWDLVASGATGTSFDADRTVIVRADQQYFFNNAGYDAGGNYVIDVPSKFWGVSYIYHSGTQPAFDGLVASLKDKDPSIYSDAVGCINPIPDSTPSTNHLPTNQPEGNMVYCGVHRALSSKQGVSSPLASVGIPGAGRVLAIPLDITVKAAISPILNITSGLASKIKIELVDTNPAAVPFVLTNPTTPITSGKPFKIRLTATDNDNVLASDFAGVKTFDFSSSASSSWGGIPSILPDGSKTCTFIAGVCTLSETYLISRGSGTAGVLSSQTITSIALEQLIPNGEVGVVGINTEFFRSIPGPEKYIFFTDKKGGTATNSVALQPLSLPGGISIKASEEFGFGVAIADSSGNYIRDMALSDNISVKGFEGTYTDLTDAPNYFFNFTTGTASSVAWPADFTKNDILTPNATPPVGVEATPKKFYDPSIPSDLTKISTPRLKNPSVYSLVLSPQNRLGKAFAVPYSATNPSLVGWPSPGIEITPGVIDHVAADLFDPNDETVNNTNAMPGVCRNLKFKLSDAKGNQLLNYTTVTNIRVKIFKVDPTHPNGIDDPKVNNSNIAADEYALLNAPEIPGPIRSGFDAISGIGGNDNSLEAQAMRFQGPAAGSSIATADSDPNAPLQATRYFPDWWYGSVPVNSGSITFPGTVCFHAAETLANRLTTPNSQYIFQVEIDPSSYANASFGSIASRGANRIFSSTYGSTALGSGHEDIITVSRGSNHHLHGAFVDDFADPKLAWLPIGSGYSYSGRNYSLDELGVESPCPYPSIGFQNRQNRGGCGSKTVYWHIHDKACNYIGPATGVTVAAPASNVGQSYLTGTPAANGAQGSSAHLVKSNGDLAQSTVYWPPTIIVSKGTLVGGWRARVLAGKPSYLAPKLTTANGSLNVDDGFDISFTLKDQFNNDVDPATSYSGSGFPEANLYITPRMHKVWTNGLPSNAPTGQGPTYANGYRSQGPWTFGSYATALGLSATNATGSAGDPNVLILSNLLFRKANEVITFSTEFKDESVSPWCAIPGNCPTTGIQTYTKSTNLNLLPGATIGSDILSLPSQNGLSFTTANFPEIFGAFEYPFTPRLSNARGFYAPKDAYGCLKDQWGNLFNCYMDSSWSIVDKRDKSNALTSDPILSSDGLGIDLAATNKMQFSALKEGTARLRVDHTGFISESDPLVVWAGPLAWLSLDAGASFNNDQAPSPIAAGQEIPVNMCLVDAANNVITTPVIHSGVTKTNPNIPYNVTFKSNVQQNVEGNSLVISAGSGANFDSQIIPNGTVSISFTNGCKTIYLKNYSSATQNPGALLTVSTSDPLRPTTGIPATDGVFVSKTTPGALDHFATEHDKAATVPVGGTVPAWSNVQANAGYANASGNRFDLWVYARDFYGNAVDVTTSITLSRIKSDGVTAVSRQMICAGQTSIGNTSCMTANFTNSKQTIIYGLASDIPGIMYAVAKSGSITTKTAVSKAINFQASLLTVKDLVIQNVPASVPAGQPFFVQVAALDNSGGQVVGADDVLSAQVFSATDQLNANLLTHVSPSNAAPSIPTSYLFLSGAANVPFTMTKKESLQFKVAGSSGMQSGLASVSVLSSSGLNYSITCRLVSDNTDCSGTSLSPYQIVASRANLFNLVVENLDTYGNKKAGSASLYLSTVKVSTPAGKMATMASTTSKSYTTVSNGSNFDNFITFSAADENGITLDNLYYGAPNQTITFDLPTREPEASIIKNAYITFSPHIDAVSSYDLTNFGSPFFAAGTTKAFKLSALDYGRNVITGIDTALNAQTYVWTGTGVSVGGFNNVLPTASLTFTNGVSQNLSATFYAANNSLPFTVKDNFTNAARLISDWGSLNRSSGSISGFGSYDGNLRIHAKAPSAYTLSGISPVAVAGAPFSLSLNAKDIYGNAAQNWTDSLTFRYLSGASPSIATPADGAVHTATIAQDVTNQDFPNGIYTVTGNPFKLYRSNLNISGAEETTLLKIQGTNTATESGVALSTTFNIRTTPKTEIAYTKITNNAVYSSANDLSGINQNYSSDIVYNYFASLFDQYGNFQTVSGAVANNVQWSGTGAMSGKLSPTAGLASVLTPISRGTGVVTADCSAISGCISDSTGTISISTGPLSVFSIVDTQTSSPVNLGSEIPFTLCMKDAVGNTIDTSVYDNGVLITNPNATLNLEFRKANITDTLEIGAIDVSKASGGSFLANRFVIGSALSSVTFVNGCAQLYAKIYSASSLFGEGRGLLNVRYDDANQPLKGTISSLGLDVPGVNPLPLDHYVTTATNVANGAVVQAYSNLGTTNVQGNAGGNRFSITVAARDVYGNALIRTNPVNLFAINSDGTTSVGRSLVCSAPANDTSCINPTFSNSSSLTVDNLALDVAGNFYINAVDSNSIGIKTSFSTLISFTASPKTVKQYAVIQPSLTNAGLSNFIQVRAEDNSGNPVAGADTALNAQTYTWFHSGDSSNMTTHIAPDGTPPILLSTLSFSSGVATAASMFAKAETGLLLNIRDNASPQKTSNNVSTLDVQPGLQLYYDIICKKVSDASDCTGTPDLPATLIGSAAEKFNLEFQALDQYKNPKSGEGAAQIRIYRIRGTATGVGKLESTDPVSYYGWDIPINMSTSAMVPQSNMFYRGANQTNRIIVTNTLADGFYRTPYITFTPTIDTVTHYAINVSGSAIAGVPQSITVFARDSGGNAVAGIDGLLNSQSYTWSGLVTSPNGSTPTYPSSALTFTAGITTGLSATIVKSGGGSLNLVDNYVPCGGCSGVGGGGPSKERNGSNNFNINAAPANSYGITGGGASTNAGVPFDLTFTALDQFENPATSWTTDTLTFAWSGATSTVVNPKNPSTTFSPLLASNGAKTFVGAAYSSTGTPFNLYKAESPTLTVTGTVTANTKNNAAITGSRVFSVLPNNLAGYVRLSKSPVRTDPTLSGLPDSWFTDQTPNLFAYLYDAYGNFKSDASLVTWSGSGALFGKLSPPTAATTVLAPTTVGTGVVTAACTGVNEGCVSDSTGTLDIKPSSVSKLVFISPSPSNNFTQLTTACQELKIQTQDLVNNPANVNSLTSFAFTSTGGGNGDFYASSAACNNAQNGRTGTMFNTSTFHTSPGMGGSQGNRTLDMASGTNVISVWYANRTSVASNAAVITVTALSRTATLNATILPDVANRVSFVTTTPTVNAAGSPSGTCLAINYRFDDIWGNQQSLTSASTVNLSVTGADAPAATIYSDSGCTTSITSRSLSSGNQDTVYYSDTKANRSTFNVLGTSTLNGTTIQAAVNILVNVLPGAFTVTQTPTNASYTKDTVTLLWGASAGAKNYNVFRATAPNCTTGATTINSAVVGTSVSFTTGLNGTYYICVVANSYTSGGTNLNATNYGSYYFIIDNTLPTGTITAPTLTSIGPVTTEMGSGATTTFTGTAADSGGSNLSKVELEIKNTTSNTYWDGSTWTAGPGPVVSAVGTTSWSYVMNDSNFTDGASYSIRAQVTDNSLNVTTNAQTKTFAWDATAPTVSITAFGNLLSSSYYSNAVNLNAAITTGSGAIKYKYYIVSGSSCSGGTLLGPTLIATNITASPGGDGQYTLCVVGIDTAENAQATPTAFTWYKDTGLPTISGGVPNMGPVNASFTPSLTAATDTGAPAGSVISYLWSVTTNATTCTTAFGSTSVQNTSITSTCGNTFGTSNLRLRVSDTAGNFTDYNPTFNWDQQSRTISAISSSLSSVSKKAGDLIDITVTYVASGNTNSANVTVNTTGGTPTLALNTTPARSATFVSSSGSTLTFNYTIQAGDNVATLNVASTSALSLNGGTIQDTYNNNASLTTNPGTALTARNIKVDTLAPTFAATGVPTSESNVTSLNVAVTATDTTNYTYSIVSGTVAACPGTQSGYIAQATNITNSISGYADGDITLCAVAKDAAGNVQSGFSSYSWKKDTVAPATVTGVGPIVEVNTLTPTISWTAGAADVTNYKVIIYSNTGLSTSVYDSGWISSGLTSQVVSPALPRDGKYFTCVLSRDLAGNQSTCSAVTFSVETDTLHTSWIESGVVKYGVKTNTSAWAASTAASGLSYQPRTSLAVDSSGNPIIGYSTINGSDSYYRFSRWNGSSWTASLAHTSTSYTAGGTLGELAVASSSPTFHTGFLGFEAGTGNFGVEFLNIASNNAATGANQALADVGATSKDLSVFVDASNYKYVVATPQSSGSYRPQIVETSSLTPTLLALPTNCTDMPYVSGVSTMTGTNFVLAGLCVMTTGSCQVWSSSFTFTSGTGTFSAPSWTSRGTTTASLCTLGGLSLADRPMIMQDKQTDKTTIVFVNRDSGKIVRATNESGTWTAAASPEDVVTGLTGTYGFPFLAIDQYSKSYVTYVDNGVLKMINNNGRENLLYTGGWNTPTVISNTGGLSGFGGIGITGMKGRGNYTGGK